MSEKRWTKSKKKDKKDKKHKHGSHDDDDNHGAGGAQSSPAPAVDAEGFSELPEDRTRVSRFFDDEHRRSFSSDSDSSDDEGKGVNKWSSLRIQTRTVKAASEAELSSEMSALSSMLGGAPESSRLSRLRTVSSTADEEDAWTVTESSPTHSDRSIFSATSSARPASEDDFDSLALDRNESAHVDTITLTQLHLPAKPAKGHINQAKEILRQEGVRLWLQPYSDETGKGHVPSKLIDQCAKALDVDAFEARRVLDYIRMASFNRKVEQVYHRHNPIPVS